jgi:hypothetical protein
MKAWIYRSTSSRDTNESRCVQLAVAGQSGRIHGRRIPKREAHCGTRRLPQAASRKSGRFLITSGLQETPCAASDQMVTRTRKLGRSATPRPLGIATHVGALVPLASILRDYWLYRLGADPIREVTLQTGQSALILPGVSLACTPLNILFGWRRLWTKPLIS